MPRYKLEIAYDGKDFHGFQSQENAITVEDVIEDSMSTYLREKIDIVGSSRTDKGVHALMNTAHFDIGRDLTDKDVYHFNSILPQSIAINKMTKVGDEFHARFDAKYRAYDYYIHTFKSPTVRHQSYYFPYRLDTSILEKLSKYLFDFTDFSSFSKKNTDVFHYQCDIQISEWTIDEHRLHYHVKSNRFLRGMVRGLVASQLSVARGQMAMDEFVKLLEEPEISKANFSTPAHGLFLSEVGY